MTQSANERPLPQLLVLGVGILAQALANNARTATYEEYKQFRKELAELCSEYGFDNADEVFERVQSLGQEEEEDETVPAAPLTGPSAAASSDVSTVARPAIAIPEPAQVPAPVYEPVTVPETVTVQPTYVPPAGPVVTQNGV